MTLQLDALSHVLDRLAEHVVLFRWGDLLFVSFGLFAALGSALTIALAGSILIGQGLEPSKYALLAMTGSVAVVLGSWFAGLALEFRALSKNPVAVLRRPIFVSWGGVIALALVGPGIGPIIDFDGLVILDALARSALLGHALGRMGCLSYGCCFGHATRGALAITYRNPDAKAVRVGGMQGVRIHPAPLYEAVSDVVIAAIVNAAALLGSPVGVPVALAILLYGVARFLVEFVRDNRGRMIHGPLSVNHALALVMAGLGALMLPVVATAAIPPPEASVVQALGALPVVEASVVQALGALPVVLAALIPASLVVFFGFATHRRKVGSW
ncbi:MAG: prolipoprotein diacylglyceryl transferase [Deltaproteobacteria bacterium]|nr:prolipoprotein diacylglyceryl transferase [Deltaproteobacteria bacterium]